MKIIQINTIYGTGSTGRIVVDLYDILEKKGHECFIGYGRGHAAQEIKAYRIGNDFDMYYHAFMTRITDKTGFYSTKATKKYIQEINKYNPDIIHLHGVHGYYINIEILFDYLSKANKPVVWTLHDCWAFTGHCAYFDNVDCVKWKTGCYSCPLKNEYPKSILFDNSKCNYENKKKLFTSVKNMKIITPSVWLAELAKQSFLNKYSVNVIHNGIDLNAFKPIENNFRATNNLTEKFIILGVANIWERRKGLSDFIKLSTLIDDKYKIVLVGLNKKQIKDLPKNILGLPRTNNVRELAEIYTMADVFVNPTFEDNFPTTNLEALACGTPVITYNTGGSVESIDDICGTVVEKGNLIDLVESIKIMKESAIDKQICINRAKLYDKKDRFGDYIKIYEECKNG